MADMPTAGGAKSVAKETLHKTLDLAFTYILPLVTFIAGFFSMAMWGGINSIAEMVVTSTGGSKSYEGQVGALVFAGIFGAFGAGFWHIGSMDGIVARGVGRGLGGYFFGLAVAYLLFVAFPTSAANGWIDDLVGKVTTATGA